MGNGIATRPAAPRVPGGQPTPILMNGIRTGARMDSFLEIRIKVAALLIRFGYTLAKRNSAQLSRLVSQRSESAIAHMEREKGLRNGN